MDPFQAESFRLIDGFFFWDNWSFLRTMISFLDGDFEIDAISLC